MIGSLLHRLRRIVWLVPGFLLWAAFPPLGEKTDVLFALAPLLWLSRGGDVKKSAWRWFASGAAYWLATLSWMPAIVKNGGPWPLVALGWFALAAYCAAFFAAFGALAAVYWRWARERGMVARLVGALFVEPVLWCGIEFVRARLFGGFAWNPLGVVAANGGFGAPAVWGGVYLLSAVIVLVNGSLAGIVERAVSIVRREPVSRLRSLETVAAFGLVFGLYRAVPAVSADADGDAAAESIKVALVQRDFPCVFQQKEENPYAAYGQLLKNVVAYGPDLVVLAESAMCEFGPLDQQGAARFAEWVWREKVPGAATLAGGTHFAEGQTYNSAALYETNGTVQIYDKVHLVPFGEFIPGDKLFPALQKLAPVGSCTPGEPRLLDFRGIPIGVAICFEDTDAALVRDFARRGARALVFITNDSWFSNSVEAEQHAWQATARAIETGLPVVRVGNSGVTGTLSPDGSAAWLNGPDGRLLVDRRGTMFDRVAVPRVAATPYVAVGDFPLALIFALLIGGLIVIQYRQHHEQRRILSL